MYVLSAVLATIAYKNAFKNYIQCISDGYTVYLNGEKVLHPDKINLSKYHITIDDDNKVVILSEKLLY